MKKLGYQARVLRNGKIAMNSPIKATEADAQTVLDTYRTMPCYSGCEFIIHRSEMPKKSRHSRMYMHSIGVAVCR